MPNSSHKPFTKQIITTRAVLYQLIGYGILLFLITGDEVFDFPHTVFGFDATPINWTEVMIESTYIVGLCVFTVYLTQRFLRQIRMMEGYIPICSFCRKIRDDKDNRTWKSLEAYINDNSEALLSHGLCPECAQKYYKIVIGGREPR